MKLSNEKYKKLIGKLDGENVLLEGNNLYFITTIEQFSIKNKHLVKLQLKKQPLYILNKRKNLVTYSKELFNEAIKRKQNKVRGYSTATIGKVDTYYYITDISYNVVAGDYDGYYWWSDNERKIKIPSFVRTYIEDLKSEFIKVA